MNIEEVINQTEKYLEEEISEQNKSLAELILRELKNIKNDNGYIVSSAVMRSILDSFDLSTPYWKKYFSVYWNNNLSRFKDPFRG